MKKIIGIYTSPRAHWVGDGFPVRTLFSYDAMGKHISPFLLLDHAGPADFTPTEQRRGVGQHPHRGFETVTIVYDGEVEHRDSTGDQAQLPGVVGQWQHWNVAVDEGLVTGVGHFVLGRQVDPQLHHFQRPAAAGKGF